MALGGGGMAYMAMVRQEIAHRGWPRYGRQQQQHNNQLARPSWDVVNPSLDKLEKEAVVPREFEHLRRTGRSRRPAGPLLRTDMASWGFSSY